MNGISYKEALDILKTDNESELSDIFKRASESRRKYFGAGITTCAIINARSGGCSENCSFCAQSKISKAVFKSYPLVSEKKIFKSAEAASKNKVSHFSIVTSGRSVKISKDLNTICRAIKKISAELPVIPCASLGILEKEVFGKLKDAGLKRYHHNLETAGTYFNKICGTRTYKDQIDTVHRAKENGLSVCSGGIFGLGETKEQRVELLETIRCLDIDSVPINFLNPIPGTKLEDLNELTPMECLKIIAAARLMMPRKNIRICGGRERNLKDFQSCIFSAGADALMIGNYLVTSGRDIAADMKMIEDAGLHL